MKKYIFLLLILCCFITNVSASTSAKTLAELRSELKALKNKKAAQDAAKTKTKNEISSAKNNIYASKKSIDEGRVKIENSKKEIEELNKEIEDGKENINELMNSIQVLKGDNIYLEYLFEAESYADLVYRYSIISQIADYNNEQIVEWEAKVSYNEELQVELTKKEEELNANIASLEKEIDNLGNDLAEISEITMDIQEEIEGINGLIKYYEGLGCKENQDLDECVSVKGDTRFRKPLTKGTITSYYGYRVHPIQKVTKFHTGVDVGGNSEGTSVYSTANGIVGMIISNTSKKVCGGRQVYIYHTINGKKYTSAYLHLLNINVSVGDSVTSNTVIGTVGGGSKTSSWESCSTGAHLHFTLAEGWYGSTYTSYSTFVAKTFDPQETLKLPNKYTYWYSR